MENYTSMKQSAPEKCLLPCDYDQFHELDWSEGNSAAHMQDWTLPSKIS